MNVLSHFLTSHSNFRNKSTKWCVTSFSLKAQRWACQSRDGSKLYTRCDPFYSVPDSQTKRHILSHFFLASLKSHRVLGPFWTMDLMARNAHTPSPRHQSKIWVSLAVICNDADTVGLIVSGRLMGRGWDGPSEQREREEKSFASIYGAFS